MNTEELTAMGAEDIRGIGEKAFKKCMQLDEIIIPKKLGTLGTLATEAQSVEQEANKPPAP